MSEVVFVKYCPSCGAENPRQQAFCRVDGEDIATVAAEPRRSEGTQPRAGAAEEGAPRVTAGTRRVDESPESADLCVLELVESPSVRFSVRDGQTVGRTEGADLVLEGVPKLDYISSRHARFFRRGDQWYIQHVAGTNFIVVDGEKYRGDEEVAFYNGSIITLSLTPFRAVLAGG